MRYHLKEGIEVICTYAYLFVEYAITAVFPLPGC